MTTWNAKRRALDIIYGNEDVSYLNIRRFIRVLERHNPDIYTWFQTEPGQNATHFHFKRLFVSFGPCRRAFRHWRSVLSIDGTHLYGRYVGHMYVATAIEANQGLIPLAFAVIEKNENISAWR